MSTRMQQRRGTAAQWISTNNGNGPILAAGEIGYESDTNKFKVGDGVNHWVDLAYFLDEAAIGGSLGDYVPVSDLAQPLGVATLDGSGKLLSSQIPNIDEISQDAINSALTAGDGISKAYDDAANTLTISNTGVLSIGGTANEISVDHSTGEVTVGLAHDIHIAGTLTLAQAPESDFQAATKLYVDNVTAGINFHEAVKVATVGNLSATYSNGTDGVGATLTNSGTKEALVIDDVALSADDRVLVKDQTDAKQNGIYVVETVGSSSANWVLTRASDADNSPAGEFKVGDFCLVLSGTTNASYGFVNSTPSAITIGTTNITYTPFNAGKTVAAGTGLWETSPGVIAIDNTVATLEDYQTFKHKGINFADNSITATIDQLNAAVTDANLATLSGTESLQHKTLLSATINDGTISGAAITGGTIDVPSLKLSGETVATATDLSTHATDTTDVHGISNTAELATKAFAASLLTGATKSNITITGDKNGLTITAENGVADSTTDNLTEGTTNLYFTDERAQDAIGNNLGTGLSYNDAAGTISVNTSTIQARVSGVSDTEIGYLDGVTSAIQTQIDSKLSTSTASSTYAPIASPTFTGNVTLDSTGDFTVSSNDNIVLTPGSGKSVKWGTDILQVRVANVSDAEIGYLDGVTSAIQTQLDAKLASSTASSTYAPIANPTFTGTVAGITKSMVGLGNVDNTSDANKPISTATQTALDLKAPLADPTFTGTVSGITKSMVGLGSVDNTSDANKPISTATQTALDLKAPKASPTFTGTTTVADIQISGALTFVGTATQIDTTNLAVTDSLIYLADSQYSADLLDIGIYGAYGNSGTNASNHPHAGFFRDASDGKWKLISGGTEPTSGVVDITGVTYDTLKIGALEATSATIGNVSNTELQYLDGVTSAIQTQLDAKAPLASPTFTGTVTLPSGTVTSAMIADGTIVNADISSSAAIAASKISGTAVTQADTGTVTSTMILDGTIVDADINASAAIAKTKIAGTAITAADTGTVTSTMIADGTIVNGDISSSAAIATSKISGLDSALSAKAPLDSPALTGTPTAPTAAALTNTTQIATTAYVQEDNKVAYVSVSGTSLTIAQSTHMFKTVHCTSNSAVSISIPTDASDNWPIGTYVNIRQMGTGQITVAAATPATTTVVATDNQFKTRVQYSEIVLEKTAANTWILVGDTAA